MNLLNELNEKQRDAVEYLSGPQLVIAGAGSGKTRVLTYKNCVFDRKRLYALDHLGFDFHQ